MIRIALSIVVLLAALSPAPAAAAPRALPGECAAFWDVALVSRALALGGVDLERSGRILAQIYQVPNERVLAIMRAIAAAAQRDQSEEASDFARRVAEACVRGQGDMDSVLGTSL